MKTTQTTARYTEGKANTDLAGVKIVQINADSKADAQEAIAVAKAWIGANGCVFKIVSFTRHTSEFSALNYFFSARIAYRAVSL